MKFFLSKFFSTSNDINENTVMGIIFATAYLFTVFFGYPSESQYTLASMTIACFGLSLGKK